MFRSGTVMLPGSDARNGFDAALTDRSATIHHHLCCAPSVGATQACTWPIGLDLGRCQPAEARARAATWL